MSGKYNALDAAKRAAEAAYMLPNAVEWYSADGIEMAVGRCLSEIFDLCAAIGINPKASVAKYRSEKLMEELYGQRDRR